MINFTQKSHLNPILTDKKSPMPTILSINIIRQFALALHVERKLSIKENSFILN